MNRPTDTAAACSCTDETLCAICRAHRAIVAKLYARATNAPPPAQEHA